MPKMALSTLLDVTVIKTIGVLCPAADNRQHNNISFICFRKNNYSLISPSLPFIFPDGENALRVDHV